MHRAVKSSERLGVEASLESDPRRPDGQALVEFALIVPIVLLILLGIVDLSRVFTSQIAIESAVREAADYGAWSSDRWQHQNINHVDNEDTVKAMTERACLASSNLLDYVGPNDACVNPKIVDIQFVHDTGPNPSNCHVKNRDPSPCWVEVTMEYTHDLIIGFGVDFMGTRLGLPDQLTFQRTSTYAISDFAPG